MFHTFFDTVDLGAWSTNDKTIQLQTMPSWNDARFNQEQTVFGVVDTKPCCTAYSDRLMEWDYKKHEKATDLANASECQVRSAEWYERYLSVYHDKVVELQYIRAGVNAATGYPYQVFGYTFEGEDG